MMGCEILFTSTRAQAFQELIETTTGAPCPCRQGQSCPFLPADGDVSGISHAPPKSLALALATAAVLPVMAVAHAAAEAVQGLAVG